MNYDEFEHTKGMWWDVMEITEFSLPILDERWESDIPESSSFLCQPTAGIYVTCTENINIEHSIKCLHRLNWLLYQYGITIQIHDRQTEHVSIIILSHSHPLNIEMNEFSIFVFSSHFYTRISIINGNCSRIYESMMVLCCSIFLCTFCNDFDKKVEIKQKDAESLHIRLPDGH